MKAELFHRDEQVPYYKQAVIIPKLLPGIGVNSAGVKVCLISLQQRLFDELALLGKEVQRNEIGEIASA